MFNTASPTQHAHGELMDRAAKLERYAELDPNNPVLLHDLCSTYHRAGEHGLALTALARWHGAMDPALEALRGQVLLALGHWSDAEQLFQAALADAPDSIPLLFNLAYSIWAAGETPDRAASLFQRVTELEPDNAGFHYHHALALEACGNTTAATQALTQALACEPTHLKSLAMLGALALDAGDFAAASEYASRCVATHPSDATGWQLRGQVALFQMDVEVASKSLRQALSLDGDDVHTYVSLAQVSMMQGRVRHARELLNAALLRDDTNEATLCALGWACLADNDMAAAQTAFDRALSSAPDHADALGGAACIQLALGQHRAADELAQRVLLLDPQHMMAKLVAAQARDVQGQAQDAKAIIESVLDATPFGPVRASVRQMLQSPATIKSAKRLQRRVRVTARAPNR